MTTLLTGISVTILGMTVTFVGLAGLWGAITIIGIIVNRR